MTTRSPRGAAPPRWLSKRCLSSYDSLTPCRAAPRRPAVLVVARVNGRFPVDNDSNGYSDSTARRLPDRSNSSECAPFAEFSDHFSMVFFPPPTASPAGMSLLFLITPEAKIDSLKFLESVSRSLDSSAAGTAL